jgi:hypothetical protein
MIKTTTLSLSQTSSLEATPPQAEKKLQVKAAEFGPSELTIQNIMNYSNALEVMSPTQTETVFGVMN